MTALLQKAIERVRALPDDEQDRVARLMLDEAEAPNEIDDYTEEERKPISEAIQEIFSDITEEEWEKLPKDGAAELDHYIYDIPKRNSGASHARLLIELLLAQIRAEDLRTRFGRAR